MREVVNAAVEEREERRRGRRGEEEERRVGIVVICGGGGGGGRDHFLAGKADWKRPPAIGGRRLVRRLLTGEGGRRFFEFERVALTFSSFRMFQIYGYTMVWVGPAAAPA